MLLPMLMNIALASGKLQVDEDGKNYRLITKNLGVVEVLAKIDKEAIYQMARTPEMPATRAEAVQQAAAKFEADVSDDSKVLADEPVPLPVQRPARQKPQLALIQGGAA
jgi:hypothetical protein